MVIQFVDNNAYLIKTKEMEIMAGNPTTAGSLPLSGPGEYEVGDVRIQGFTGAYLFSAEDMNILYVDNSRGLSDQVVKQIEEDIDILLLALDTDTAHVREAVKFVNDLDPKIAIPAVEDATHPFCKEIGGCQPAIPELKVSKKDLVEEARKVVILHARSRSRK